MERLLRRLYNIWRRANENKKYKDMAKNAGIRLREPVFFVIQCDVGQVGLFSYVNLILSKMNVAIRLGWIPVIDMQTYPSTYLENQYVGVRNAWEYYFQQPCGSALMAAFESDNRMKADDDWTEQGPYSAMVFYEDKYGEKTYWRDFVHKYLRIQPEIQNKVDLWCGYHWKKDERVLGVLCRGTDYLSLKPSMHPIQPNPSDVVLKTEELLQKWNCDSIYLSTEDQTILDLFKNAFGDRLNYLERPYVENVGKEPVTQVDFHRKDDRRIQGEEYLTQVLILSRCTCLLAGQCGGTLGAELFSDGYEEEMVWDLGRY